DAPIALFKAAELMALLRFVVNCINIFFWVMIQP
ncbi:MAG: hypothetical protein ACI8RO_001699, partial [Flavobacteriales bacterium]